MANFTYNGLETFIVKDFCGLSKLLYLAYNIGDYTTCDTVENTLNNTILQEVQKFDIERQKDVYLKILENDQADSIKIMVFYHYYLTKQKTAKFCFDKITDTLNNMEDTPYKSYILIRINEWDLEQV